MIKANDNMLYAVLPHNMKLYTNSFTKQMDELARRLELADVKVFLADHPNGGEAYLVFKNGTAIFQDTAKEVMHKYLDFLSREDIWHEKHINQHC